MIRTDQRPVLRYEALEEGREQPTTFLRNCCRHWAPIHALWKIGCVWSALRFFSSFAMRKADRLAYRLSGPYDGRIVDWLGGANPTPRRLRPSPKSGAGRDARPSMQRSIPYLSLKNPEAVVSPTGRVPCLVALDQVGACWRHGWAKQCDVFRRTPARMKWSPRNSSKCMQ